MIDTHCHLTHAKLRDEEQAILDRASEAGLEACISIGTGVEDAERVLALTKRHPGYVFGTAGLDPFTSHDAGEGFGDALEALGELLGKGGFVALGEIGLDYHYDLDSRPVQAERFERQLELAERLDLPVVIHVREAHEDMAAILGAHPGNRGVIHSFTGGPVEAERYLALGWYLAFNGVATYPKADDVRAAAGSCPEERLLLETDAPYLAPKPFRGKRCEPAYVALTAARVAEARGAEVAQVRAAASKNARELFGLGRVKTGTD